MHEQRNVAFQHTSDNHTTLAASQARRKRPGWPGWIALVETTWPSSWCSKTPATTTLPSTSALRCHRCCCRRCCCFRCCCHYCCCCRRCFCCRCFCFRCTLLVLVVNYSLYIAWFCCKLLFVNIWPLYTTTCGRIDGYLIKFY